MSEKTREGGGRRQRCGPSGTERGRGRGQERALQSDDSVPNFRHGSRLGRATRWWAGWALTRWPSIGHIACRAVDAGLHFLSEAAEEGEGAPHKLGGGYGGTMVLQEKEEGAAARRRGRRRGREGGRGDGEQRLACNNNECYSTPYYVTFASPSFSVAPRRCPSRPHPCP